MELAARTGKDHQKIRMACLAGLHCAGPGGLRLTNGSWTFVSEIEMAAEQERVSAGARPAGAG